MKIKSFLSIFLIALFIFNNCSVNIYANEVDKYINAREMNVIIVRLMGVTENMIESEVVNNVPDYIPENFIESFSDRERMYYNMLYNIYNKYADIIKANPVITGYNEFSARSASRYDFINAMLLCNGIVGSNKYIKFKEKELGYMSRYYSESEENFYLGELVTLDNLKPLINSFLKNKPLYYYNEADFLKGNINPIVNKKKLTNYDILCNNYGYKNISEIYEYVLEDIVHSEYVKRIEMVRKLDSLIGYTSKEFNDLYAEGKVIMPYLGEADDIVDEYDAQLIAYAKYYFDIKSYEAWDVLISREKSTTPEEYNRSYTIRAQELITGQEVFDYMTYYLNNNGYDTENIMKVKGNISFVDKLTKDNFERLLDAFSKDLNA